MPGHRPVHRIFFALKPNTATAKALQNAIAALQSDGVIRTSPVAESRLHLTLHFLGDFENYPEEMVSRVSNGAADFRHEPFSFTLDRMIMFRRPRPPYVLVTDAETTQAVRSFRRALGKAIGLSGETPGESRFRPHVTLAHGERPLPGPVPITPIEWNVEDFALIESLVGKSVHRQLGKWSLRD